MHSPSLFFFFFFNDTATTEIYTLSLHDALPISPSRTSALPLLGYRAQWKSHHRQSLEEDRKSTRLNSSHSQISYAVFCLKKKKKNYTQLLTIQSNDYPRTLVQMTSHTHLASREE